MRSSATLDARFSLSTNWVRRVRVVHTRAWGNRILHTVYGLVLELPPDRLSCHVIILAHTLSFALAPNLCETITTRCYTFYPSNYLFQCLLIFHSQHQWFNLFSTNQPTIFHNAAVLHGYIQPETVSLDDVLSVHKGSPWDGATDWKDFCKRSDLLSREP